MDKKAYENRIEAARLDATELGRIADELQHIGGPIATTLRLRAIAQRLQLRKSVPPATTAPWAEQLGIGLIDGRPLYAYRVTDAQFTTLQDSLAERRRALALPNPGVLAAQFVLWAAEWFRRSYDGTGQRWDALGQVLGVSLEQHEWRRLTDRGMAIWKIPPFKLNGMHHRLAAIARQGGFPVAALDADGWAARFLETLVATLAAMPPTDLDGAIALTDQAIGVVPDTWRSRELRVVACELALEVVRLRRLAEAGGIASGALVSAWLALNVPNWRDELPLSLGSEAARLLMDGLLRVTPLRGGSDAVRCVRWLELQSGGQRRTGVELKLEGILKDASGMVLTASLAAGWSRLRLFPSGQFAQHVSGELAVADPDDEGTWRVRSSTTRARIELNHSIPITTELRGDGRRVSAPFQIAGGEHIVGELHVYCLDSDEGDRKRLRLVGTGSGGYRPAEIFIDIPSGWTAVANGVDSACEATGEASGSGRVVWRVRGSALVRSLQGDSYLVRSGQTGQSRDRLVLESSAASFALGEPGIDLVRGKPILRIEENGRDRHPASGELWWRPRGEATWRSDPSHAAIGPCEFAWRDRATQHIRDRREAIVLPIGLAIDLDHVGDWIEIRLRGWPCSAQALSGTAHGQNTWRLPSKANTRSSLTLRLCGAPGGQFEVLVPLQHQAWIESWTEGPLRKDGGLSLSTINRFVARAERCELMADLFDRHGKPVPQGQMSWWVDGDLPLSAIRDDLAALLRPCGDIRARVRLNFNDGHEDYWWVGEFEHDLREERGGFIAEPAVAEDGVRMVRRALHDPAQEEDCGPFSLIDSLHHRPHCLPRQRGGALVYLRSGERVLSAPRPVESNVECHPQTPLGRAMAIASWHERKIALERLATAVCAEPAVPASRHLVRNIIDLALSLDGLPPATFDALLLLCDHFALAPLLLFQARQSEIGELMRLSDFLPFAWWLIPTIHWQNAANDRFGTLLDILPDQQIEVAKDVAIRAREIAQIEPALNPLLGLSVETSTLADAVMRFFQRSHDRIDISVPNPFRTLRAPLLPRWKIENERYWRAFDAPLIAAHAAHGNLVLTPPEIMAAKDIARRHPRWFREGFAAALREL